MAKPRKYATTTEAAIRECIAAGMTTKETAAKLNISHSALNAVRNVLGITSPTRVPQSDAVPAWWVPAMANGATLATIGKAEGKHLTSIRAALQRRGLPTSRSAAAAYLEGVGAPAPEGEIESAPVPVAAIAPVVQLAA